MAPLPLPALPFASARDWSELARRRPALPRVLAFPVLPLALLPPLVLYLAGTLDPARFPPALARGSWGALAAAFFATEVATWLALGWLIACAARSSRVAIDRPTAYLIAALAPVPLWLSSLGLLVADLVVTLGLAGLALALSCRAVYHGIAILGGVRESVTAAWITQIAVGGALIPWVLLDAALLWR